VKNNRIVDVYKRFSMPELCLLLKKIVRGFEIAISGDNI